MNKNYEKAIFYYDESLKIDKKFINALNNKGHALQLLNKPDEALECFNNSLSIDPNNVISYN